MNELTTNENVLPALPEEEREYFWLAFLPEVGEKKARERFQERFGYEPKRVLVHNGLLLAGPICKSEE